MQEKLISDRNKSRLQRRLFFVLVSPDLTDYINSDFVETVDDVVLRETNAVANF